MKEAYNLHKEMFNKAGMVKYKDITLTTINQIYEEKFNQASMVRCKEMTLVVEAVNYTAYICSQFVQNIR